VKANKVGAYIKLENDWQPDVVVLNNDLTSGIPEEFNNISQPILPSPKLGWHTRLKSNHFKAFDKLANEFAEKFSFDPWFITTFTDNCGSIDFKNKKGLECLAQHVEKVIEKTAEKYRQYSIHKEPYAFVKADRGTYGMGVMMLRSGDDILNLNKKDRHSMGAIKHGIQNSEVMVQEGVPTIELYNDSPSETMAYMLAGNVIEMLMRSNSLKDELSNLNSNGMEILIHNDTKFGIKHVIAMLASLAVIFE
jgi:glutamate--cysteine ligase